MAETLLLLSGRTNLVEPTRTEGEVAELSLNSDGRLRVASKQGFFPTVSGVLTASGTSLPCDVADASNVVLHVKNTGSAAMAAGAFVFEGSNDSTDGVDGVWFALQAVRSDSNTIENGRGTASLAAGAGQAYAWELSINAIRWFRIRCSTTVTTNAQATWTIVRGSYATEPIPASQTHAVTLPVGTEFSLVTAASTNATLVSAGSIALNEISISNVTAAIIYVKLYNKATAPTVGTDVPRVTIPVPVGGLVTVDFGSIGKRFPLGLGLAVTAGAAANDTAAVTVGAQIHATRS